MKRLLGIVIAVSLLAGFSSAQMPDKVSKASHRYALSRNRITKPSYHLAKIQAIVKRLKHTEDDPVKPSKAVLDSFSFDEMFTYIMIHGENQQQICDVMPEFEDAQNKIFGQMPDLFWTEESSWSDDQKAYMAAHRTEFVNHLRDLIKLRGDAGINVKTAVVVLNAYELIPDLVSLYKEKRTDQDILTALLLLMKAGNYQPFIKSQTYEKLYADEDSSWKSFVVANRENQDLELGRAMDYYQSVAK